MLAIYDMLFIRCGGRMKRLQWVLSLVAWMALGGCSGSQSSSLDVNDVCKKDNNYTAYTCTLGQSTINLCLDDCTFPSWCPKEALTLGDTTRLATVGCSTLGSQPPPADTCIVHGINGCQLPQSPQYICKKCDYKNSQLQCEDSSNISATLDLSQNCS